MAQEVGYVDLNVKRCYICGGKIRGYQADDGALLPVDPTVAQATSILVGEGAECRVKYVFVHNACNLPESSLCVSGYCDGCNYCIPYIEQYPDQF